jgi:hypothetical protein
MIEERPTIPTLHSVELSMLPLAVETYKKLKDSIAAIKPSSGILIVSVS